MRPFFRFPFWPLLGALAASLLSPLPAAAAGGNALVIGESSYAGVATLPDCRQAADLLSARLRHLGYAVDEIIDASADDARVALNRFAGDVASTPDQPSFAYVCAAAATEEQRLFLLPSDVDLHQPYDPETQGIVIPVFLNAMRGSDGTLVGELALQSGGDQRPTLDALRARLPTGLHFALTMSDAQHAGSVGLVLASSGTPLTAQWDALVPSLRAQAQKTAVAVYAPVPVAAVPVATPAPAAAKPLLPAKAPAVATPAPVTVAAPATAPAPAPVAAATAPVPAPAAPTPQAPPLPPLPVLAIPPAPPEQAVAAAPKVAQTAHAKHPEVSSYARSPNLRFERLQTALRDQGLYQGPVNGVMNTRTIMAIRAYQISIGKPSSGTLTGPEIIQLLNNR